MLLRVLVLALLIGALLVPGCRRDDAPSARARAWTRVDLAHEAPPPTRPPATAADLSASGPGWTLPAHGELVRGTLDGTPVVRLSAERPFVASHALDLRASAIDFADVTLHVPDGEEEFVRVSFREAGRARAYSAIEVVEGTTGLRTVRFDLRAMRELEGDLDELYVHFGNQASSLALARVHLARRPATALLPDATDGPGLVALGTDARRGVGLGPGSTLVATAPAGGRLTFSFRVGNAAECGDSALVVEHPGAPLHLPLAGGPRWGEATLDVDAGDRLRFRLDGASGRDPHTVVADVGVRDASALPAAGAPRTVVLITSDTHRGDLLGVLAGAEVRTPHLDALAARGVLFEDAVATSNSTNPSHVALLTGVHPRDTRVITNSSPLSDRASTLAERFRDAGWRTLAAVSVVHLGDRMSGLGQGFDRFDAPPFPTGAEVAAHDGSADSVRLGGDTVDAALAHLEDAGDLPVFLWVHVYDAHVPYLPPPDFDRRYYGAARDEGEGPGLAVPEEDLHGSFHGVRDPEFPWAQYRALVDYVDHALAPLLEHPRARGGVVAFTADHGETFGNHGTWFDHLGIYRDNTHVPLVLAWPGAPVARVPDPVEQMHVGRTLLALAGLPAVDFPGRDLTEALEGTWAREPRYAIAGGGLSASLDDGRWVCVLHMEDETSNDGTITWREGQIELFDRASDPACARDVVADHLDRAARMRRALLDWLAGAAPRGMAGEFYVTPAAAQALARLGYAAGTAPSGAWYAPGEDDDWERRYGR